MQHTEQLICQFKLSFAVDVTLFLFLLLQVLSPGSILATQGAGGQQILHVIHTIPSVSMPSKVGQLQTIPVVVQSHPVVYTTMTTDSVATAAITVPLIGSDGRSEGSGECC